MTVTPRVFVSAVSSDLRTARKIVNQALTQLGCLPVEESISGTEYGRIREMLQRWMAPCQAVIHVVGRDYGGEPDPGTMPSGQPRRSWTQMEYDYAVERNKKLYVIVCDEKFPFEPREQSEPQDKADLQAAHRKAVLAGEYLWLRVGTEEELRRAVERMKLPLDELRAELRRQQVRGRWFVGTIAAAIVLLLIGAIIGLSQLGRKVDDANQQVADVNEGVKDVKDTVGKLPEKIDESAQETVRQLTNPDALAASIRRQIEAAAKEKIDAVPKEESGRWEKIVEIERQRDVQLTQVDDLIQLIQDGLKEGATEVFLRAVEILNDSQQGGVDAAIAYLETRRPTTFEIARRHAQRAEREREQRNRALQALVLEAQLRENKLDWSAALKLREQVAELAPDWFEARNYLGTLLHQLARYPEAEPHKRAALALAATPKEKGSALNNLALLLRATNRLAEAESLMRHALAIAEQTEGRIFNPSHPEHDRLQAAESPLATALSNLGELLSATKRLAEAEPLMRRALAIDEQSYGTDHPNVAMDLSNLATLLQDTNRLAEAEPLMRRALAIDEHAYGAEHPDVAIKLNNLAMLLQAMNRLAEAEPYMRRALAIFEQSWGAEHPDVATALSNLVTLLQDTNRLAEAEPLIRRALAIDEQTYGAKHPSVAIRLNNLAQSLQTMNRLAEAEPLMRRALAIDVQSWGAEHPDVAGDLNNLAQLLTATNRPVEAEPLMRRALAIDEQAYGTEHPRVAMQLYNLAQLLGDTIRLAEAEPLMRRALAIDEQSYGAGHPAVARDVNNLAQLLQDTNRLAEAEPLMRRALVIDEHSSGAEHPDVAIGLNNLGSLFHATNRLAEAEPLMRRALAVAEQSYGAEHPDVATDLNNLAFLLQATNRLAEAEPLMRRALTILSMKSVTNHSNTIFVRDKYRLLLAEMELGEAEIERRVQAAVESKGPLEPIVPEVERLLGAAKPVHEVLATLDEQYRQEGRPEVYFLKPDQSIAPHLDRLLKPTRDALSSEGLQAFFAGDSAMAVVLQEAAAELNGDQPDAASWSLINRMNRAAALRHLGALEQARDELKQVATDMQQAAGTSAAVLGRCHFHLALCEALLGTRDAAKATISESLRVYAQAPEDAPVPPPQVEQSRQLLADLESGQEPPPRNHVDVEAELGQARARLTAAQKLATLPLDQPAGPLLDEMFGPAKTVREVLDELDRQYREQGKPAVWILPLDEPISPHLDELLGPTT